MKVWYYKPWAYHPKVNPEYVFDAKGKCVLDEDKEKTHPLSRIYKRRVRSSMVEVPERRI